MPEQSVLDQLKDKSRKPLIEAAPYQVQDDTVQVGKFWTNEVSRTLAEEAAREIGQKVNEVRTLFQSTYDEIKTSLEEKELNQKLASEAIDISLPSTKVSQGAPNILEKLIEEVEEVCMSMGYDVVDGPEIEEDKYNFEMLNIPK